MSAKTDYIIAILNGKKNTLLVNKAQREHELSSKQNELLIVQNSIEASNNAIAQINWELTTIDQAIAKIMELD